MHVGVPTDSWLAIIGACPNSVWVWPRGTHREQHGADVEHDVMGGLLRLADGAHHQPSYLVAPPLKAHHQQAWYG